MAFYNTANRQSLMETIGKYLQLVEGSTVLAAGAATVTIPQAVAVKFAIPVSQTSNAARCTATSGNTFTLSGTGTDRVDWLAVVVPRA